MALEREIHRSLEQQLDQIDASANKLLIYESLAVLAFNRDDNVLALAHIDTALAFQCACNNCNSEKLSGLLGVCDRIVAAQVAGRLN